MALPACQGQLKVGSSGGAPPHLPFKYQHFQTQAEAFANFSECNANVSNASNYNRMYPPPPPQTASRAAASAVSADSTSCSGEICAVKGNPAPQGFLPCPRVICPQQYPYLCRTDRESEPGGRAGGRCPSFPWGEPIPAVFSCLLCSRPLHRVCPDSSTGAPRGNRSPLEDPCTCPPTSNKQAVRNRLPLTRVHACR